MGKNSQIYCKEELINKNDLAIGDCYLMTQTCHIENSIRSRVSYIHVGMFKSYNSDTNIPTFVSCDKGFIHSCRYV